MVFSLKKKNGNPENYAELTKKLQESEVDGQFYFDAIRTLLVMLKKFPLDLKEIDTQGFIRYIDELEQKIISLKKASLAQPLFEKSGKVIVSFIERHKIHLGEREKELKEIIDLLSKAMAQLGAENQNYNEQLYRKTENIEKLTLLDDIRAIKNAIRHEVEQIRAVVEEKQDRDSQRIAALTKKVGMLETQLKKVETESSKDGLTGLYNRRSFDRKIKDMVEKNLISPMPFSLLMIDIDDFKQINDAYGHQIGDRVLLAVVQKALTFTRSDDFPARYGGEEFVVLLPGASLRNAVKIGRRICKSLASTQYAISETDGKKHLRITVSIGVSNIWKKDTVQTVMKRADDALYQAKKSGKNRVVSEKELR
jgi:diguanylate cyclase